jgi:hypothetical protein
MRKALFPNGSIHRSVAIPISFVLLLLTARCDSKKPIPPTPPPNIGPDAVQALQNVVRQADETKDFVVRFKHLLNNFGDSQINIAKNKYAATVTPVNATVDLLEQKMAGTTTLTDEQFTTQATAAVDANLEFNTVLEGGLENTANFNNFVLTNHIALNEAWTKIWRAAPGLSPDLKQQLRTFLESRIRYKSWDATQ